MPAGETERMCSYVFRMCFVCVLYVCGAAAERECLEINVSSCSLLTSNAACVVGAAGLPTAFAGGSKGNETGSAHTPDSPMNIDMARERDGARASSIAHQPPLMNRTGGLWVGG